jgi:hypothetical protein
MRKRPSERIDLWRGQAAEQTAQPAAQQGLRRAEGTSSIRRKAQDMPATVLRHRLALDQPDFSETGE